MRKIVLSTVAMALIATSVSPAVAARSHHVRKTTPAREQLRNARDAVAQQSQPAWPYSGWSAPAGR
ncbi:hypothetical protein ACVIW2_001050 [Bradyrhizobium huanghuaihaiense]|uniref:Uncharacterized protein n=1 Tax=Bradyrhizobium huanghuaihaiense TaxID=990078 RepID=A0A562RPY7_9BRAD|nr:hypothetical protein [Bradyrhizobium huanghuaihaiense]TWI71003.1 hypothetical protein IQ16_03417 [Bradyrhizobium huanghuaihaiense]